VEFFVFVVSLLAAVALAPWVLKSSVPKREKKAQKIEQVQVDGFPPTQEVMGIDKMTGIAIDEVHRKLCLVRCPRPGAGAVGQDGVYTPVWEPASSTVVRYGDILSVDVFEDTAPSQSYSTNIILRVELHVIVKNTAAPTHTVLFLDSRVFANSAEHRAAMKQARHWHGVLEAAIHASEMRAARELAAEAAAAAPALPVADQLQQLVALRDEGVLTELEFQRQKARLLA
jgi:hypothetical protein